jgi:hypothetical protein
MTAFIHGVKDGHFDYLRAARGRDAAS